MGAILGKRRKCAEPSKIEKRMVQAMVQKSAAGKSSLKSFNSIIMKFPKIDETFENVRGMFEKFDKDGSGTIDLEELKECFRQLKVSFTDDEVKEFHEESDMDSSKGIDFKEFIVVLALLYLLGDSVDASSGSRIGLPELESTFDTIVDAFIFFDKDGDGYVSKKEIVLAINDASPGRRGAGDRIGVKRFEEMDWDKNGSITFKEFLFAFTNWVGLQSGEDE
eukprot:c24487_g1_i2 orf=496-1161(-)